MKIYVLFWVEKYEPAFLGGVFTSMENAEKVATDPEMYAHFGRQWKIREMIIDEKTDFICV